NALSEKSKEAKSLQTKVKKLGGNLTSAQKNSSMKEETKLRISDSSEVLFLKSKLAELEQMKDELSLNVSKLERLKSDDISRVLPLGEAISGGDEKNISISSHPGTAFSNDTSSVSQSDAPYTCGRNMLIT